MDKTITGEEYFTNGKKILTVIYDLAERIIKLNDEYIEPTEFEIGGSKVSKVASMIRNSFENEIGYDLFGMSIYQIKQKETVVENNKTH